MDEQLLSKVQGTVIALGPHKDFAQRTRYDFIRLRISDSRETTVRNVVVGAEANRYLATDKAVALYLIQSPAGDKCLFAIDADSGHSILADGLLDEGPSANGEPRMLSDHASRQPGRRRLRRAVADIAIAGVPIAAANAGASKEKRHAECDQ